MIIKECPKCGACWLDEQLYWADGKMACPHDLAGLVCNLPDKALEEMPKGDCINPCKGTTSGITWKHREQLLDFFDI